MIPSAYCSSLTEKKSQCKNLVRILRDSGAVRAGVGSFEDADDLAFGAAVAAKAGDSDGHAVAVHGLSGRAGRQEDIAVDGFDGSVSDDEAIAVAVEAQAARNEFRDRIGQADSLPGLLSKLQRLPAVIFWVSSWN